MMVLGGIEDRGKNQTRFLRRFLIGMRESILGAHTGLGLAGFRSVFSSLPKSFVLSPASFPTISLSEGQVEGPHCLK